MKVKSKLARVAFALLLVVLAVFGALKFEHYLVWSAWRNRSLADMEALAAAVQYYEAKHGHLPTQTEYKTLPPSPIFANKRVGSPEFMTNYDKPTRKAGDVTDPYGRPFQYELTGNSFLIRSLGFDGIMSTDDFILHP
jgi:hypothetical protein